MKQPAQALISCRPLPDIFRGRWTMARRELWIPKTSENGRGRLSAVFPYRLPQPPINKSIISPFLYKNQQLPRRPPTL